MATRKENEADPQSCLNRAEPDEPIFVLRSTDEIAPILVEIWASLRALRPDARGKVQDARDVAAAMRSWKRRDDDRRAKYAHVDPY